MKFVINKPSVWMYKTDNLCGEVSDELLFGTVLEILSENDTCVYCRTDYGYCGYINKWEICDCETEDCYDGEKQFVYGRCDVLTSPEYRNAPVMSLPCGSRVRIVDKYDKRFSVCAVRNKKYFISNHVLERERRASFADELVGMAEKYIGVPYRWGGKSDEGTDCSGLVFMCARMCGRKLYRDAVPMTEFVNITDEKNAQKGDLIYFKGHVAIISGENEIIHSCAREGKTVRCSFENSGLEKSNILCYARIK